LTYKILIKVATLHPVKNADLPFKSSFVPSQIGPGVFRDQDILSNPPWSNASIYPGGNQKKRIGKARELSYTSLGYGTEGGSKGPGKELE
jgi:hypothetical protein